MCNDLAALGLVAMDQNGGEIMASCGNGAQADCNDANPAASCPDMVVPICAHLDFAGTAVVNCGQRCTP
jgi:hypothetical protein